MTSSSLTILLVWGVFVIVAMLVIRSMGGTNAPAPRDDQAPADRAPGAAAQEEKKQP